MKLIKYIIRKSFDLVNMGMPNCSAPKEQFQNWKYGLWNRVGAILVTVGGLCLIIKLLFLRG